MNPRRTSALSSSHQRNPERPKVSLTLVVTNLLNSATFIPSSVNMCNMTSDSFSINIYLQMVPALQWCLALGHSLYMTFFRPQGILKYLTISLWCKHLSWKYIMYRLIIYFQKNMYMLCINVSLLGITSNRVDIERQNSETW